MLQEMPVMSSGGGGGDASSIIGKIIWTTAATVSTSELIVANVTNINEVEVNISNFWDTGMYLNVNGYVGDTKTQIDALSTTGTHTVDVSSYERLSINTTKSAGCSVSSISVVS